MKPTALASPLLTPPFACARKCLMAQCSVTPAMEAGVSDNVWSLDEIIQLLPLKPTNSVLE